MTKLRGDIFDGDAIDFDAREMTPNSVGLRNHGTKFRVAPENITQLYIKKERFS